MRPSDKRAIATSIWRGLRFTEFEQRQLDAVRKDLNVEYEASITRSDQAIPTASFQEIGALT
jgi:Glu-tRNA(Gln) amidotransferase subunit E-like FAD-binding protein